jgi:hypothetical protein
MAHDTVARIEAMIIEIEAEITRLESRREWCVADVRREVSRDASGFGTHTAANLAQQMVEIVGYNDAIQRAYEEIGRLNVLIGRD